MDLCAFVRLCIQQAAGLHISRSANIVKSVFPGRLLIPCVENEDYSLRVRASEGCGGKSDRGDDGKKPSVQDPKSLRLGRLVAAYPKQKDHLSINTHFSGT